MLLTTFLLALVVYSNTLLNGFVFDDHHQVLENPWIRDVRHLPEIFSKSVWGFQALPVPRDYYRPFMHVVFMLNYFLFGLKPWGFHFVNMLFHAGNAVLVFLIVSRLLKRSRQPALEGSDDPYVTGRSGFSLFLFPPFLAALFFAVHPIHTESVAWIGAIPELSYTFFGLLSLYLYCMSETDMKSSAYVLSVLSFSLALFCKETALILPALLVLYDVTFPGSGKRLLDYLKRYVPYVAISGVFLFLRSYALGGGKGEFGLHVSSIVTYQYIMSIFPLFLKYIDKLLLPVNLNAVYVVSPITALPEPKELLSLTVVAVYVMLSVIAYKRYRPAFIGFACIIIPLLPVFYVPAMSPINFSERYLYLPSVGFVIILAFLFDRLREKKLRYGPLIILLAVSVLGLYSIGTIKRNPVWKNDLSLFSDAANKSPNSEVPNGMFGITLLDEGKTDEAIEQFRTTLKIDPDYELAYYYLGRAFMEKGLPGEAVGALRKAVSLNPDDIDAHQLLALAYAKSKMMDEALEEYRTFMGWEPNSPLTFTNFGKELEKEGLLDEAILQYKKAIALNANFVAAHYYLALAYEKSGQPDRALEHLKVTVKLQPNQPQLHNLLGIAYARKGANDAAIEEFEAAVKLAPADPSYRKNLERALGQKKLVK